MHLVVILLAKRLSSNSFYNTESKKFPIRLPFLKFGHFLLKKHTLGICDTVGSVFGLFAVAFDHEELDQSIIDVILQSVSPEMVMTFCLDILVGLEGDTDKYFSLIAVMKPMNYLENLFQNESKVRINSGIFEQ